MFGISLKNCNSAKIPIHLKLLYLISKTASNVQIRQAIYKDSIKKYLPYKYLFG